MEPYRICSDHPSSIVIVLPSLLLPRTPKWHSFLLKTNAHVENLLFFGYHSPAPSMTLPFTPERMNEFLCILQPLDIWEVLSLLVVSACSAATQSSLVPPLGCVPFTGGLAQHHTWAYWRKEYPSPSRWQEPVVSKSPRCQGSYIRVAFEQLPASWLTQTNNSQMMKTKKNGQGGGTGEEEWFIPPGRTQGGFAGKTDFKIKTWIASTDSEPLTPTFTSYIRGTEWGLPAARFLREQTQRRVQKVIRDTNLTEHFLLLAKWLQVTWKYYLISWLQASHPPTWNIFETRVCVESNRKLCHPVLLCVQYLISW